MKRTFVFILSLVFAVSLVACNVSEGDSEESASILTSESQTEASDVLSELDLPSGIELDDKQITIVHWTESVFDEFSVDEEDRDKNIVCDAVYNRNLQTEKLLNISLNFEPVGYLSSSIGNLNIWCDVLQNLENDPSSDVDIFACYSRTSSNATIRGLNKDLSKISGLNLSKGWWPEGVTENSSVGGKIFYITGEISPGAVGNMYTVFYNKSILLNNNITATSELVKDKMWTVDKMIELTSGIYAELDGEKGKTKGDSFGISLSWWCAEAIVKGAGFKLSEDGGLDVPIKLSPNVESASLADLIQKLGDWCGQNSVFNDKEYAGDASVAFFEGRSAFYINVVDTIEGIKQAHIDYGILPMPLLDSSQQKYITYLGNTYSNYSIASSCDDDESAAAVISALAYYGQSTVTPAIYRLYTENSSADCADTAEIFGLMLEGMCQDVDKVFNRQLENICDEIPGAIRDGKSFKEEFSDFDRKNIERSIGILNNNLKSVIG